MFNRYAKILVPIGLVVAYIFTPIYTQASVLTDTFLEVGSFYTTSAQSLAKVTNTKIQKVGNMYQPIFLRTATIYNTLGNTVLDSFSEGILKTGDVVSDVTKVLNEKISLATDSLGSVGLETVISTTKIATDISKTGNQLASLSSIFDSFIDTISDPLVPFFVEQKTPSIPIAKPTPPRTITTSPTQTVRETVRTTINNITQTVGLTRLDLISALDTLRQEILTLNASALSNSRIHNSGQTDRIFTNIGSSLAASTANISDSKITNSSIGATTLSVSDATATSTFAGHVSITGNLNFNGSFLQNGSPFISSQWTTSGSNVYYNTGNVGIGTTTPYAKLSVEGNSALGNSALAGYFIATSTTASTFPYASTTALTVSGNAYFPGSGIWNASGNVGIGTTSPWATLAVNPVAGGASNQFVVGSSTATNFIVTNGGNVGIGTASPTQKLDVAGSVNVSSGSAYKYNGSNVITAQTSLNNYFFGGGGNLTMTGNSNIASGFESLLSNTTGTYNSAYGREALYSNTTGDSNTALGYTSLSANTTGSWNTAIGHSALLDLNITANDGSGKNTAVGYKAGQGLITGTNNTFIGANITVTNSALSNNIILADGAGNQRINVGSTGAVGVSSSTPWATLAVNPTAGQASNQFVVGSSTATSFIINNAGKVGIGTTSPNYTLDVNGDVNVASGKCFRVNGVCIGYTVKLAAIYATSTPGTNAQVVFTGAQASAPSFSAGVLTLPSNTSYIVTEVWGAGGGGSGGGTNTATNGGSGNQTCFGTNSTACTSPSLSATGGSAGVWNAASGTGGSGSGGDINMTGGLGGGSDDNNATLTAWAGGTGGSAPRGGAGGASYYSSAGSAGASFGGGGGGGSANGSGASYTGGSGGGGGGYSQKLITSPTGTYYYTVGTAGTGGAAGSGGLDGGAGGAGGLVITVYATSSPNATGNDYAELFPVSNPSIGAGDIVAVDVGAPVSMKLAQKGDTALAGVISTAPGHVLGDQSATGMRPVALSGRVPVKFSNENGNVKIGDRIAVSSTPGVGMKAGVFDDSVGIVIDDVLADGTVMIFLDLHQGINIGVIAKGLLNIPLDVLGSNEQSNTNTQFDFVGNLLSSISSRLVASSTIFGLGSALDILKNFVFSNNTSTAQGTTTDVSNASSEANLASSTNALLNYFSAVPYTVEAINELNLKLESLATSSPDTVASSTATSSPSFVSNFWNNLYTRIENKFGFGSTTEAIREIDGRLNTIASTTATGTVADLINPSTDTSSSTAPWKGMLADASDALKAGISSIGDVVIYVFNNVVYATTGIYNKIFAKEVYTDRLCVGATCVTEDQLKTLLQNSGQSSEGSSSPTSSSTSTDTSTSTSTPTSEPTSSSTPAESTPTSASATTTDSTTTTSESTPTTTEPASTEPAPVEEPSPVVTEPTPTPEPTPTETPVL